MNYCIGSYQPFISRPLVHSFCQPIYPNSISGRSQPQSSLLMLSTPIVTVQTEDNHQLNKSGVSQQTHVNTQKSNLLKSNDPAKDVLEILKRIQNRKKMKKSQYSLEKSGVQSNGSVENKKILMNPQTFGNIDTQFLEVPSFVKEKMFTLYSGNRESAKFGQNLDQESNKSVISPNSKKSSVYTKRSSYNVLIDDNENDEQINLRKSSIKSKKSQSINSERNSNYQESRKRSKSVSFKEIGSHLNSKLNESKNLNNEFDRLFPQSPTKSSIKGSTNKKITVHNSSSKRSRQLRESYSDKKVFDKEGSRFSKSSYSAQSRSVSPQSQLQRSFSSKTSKSPLSRPSFIKGHFKNKVHILDKEMQKLIEEGKRVTLLRDSISKMKGVQRKYSQLDDIYKRLKGKHQEKYKNFKMPIKGVFNSNSKQQQPDFFEALKSRNKKSSNIYSNLSLKNNNRVLRGLQIIDQLTAKDLQFFIK